jgi:hypothetical protein
LGRPEIQGQKALALNLGLGALVALASRLPTAAARLLFLALGLLRLTLGPHATAHASERGLLAGLSCATLSRLLLVLDTGVMLATAPASEPLVHALSVAWLATSHWALPWARMAHGHARRRLLAARLDCR